MSVAHAALENLLALTARAPVNDVAIETGAPALKTRVFAEEAAAAALAAGASVAADLWTLRSGERQHAAVSTRAAAASLLSFAFQQFDDPAKAPPAHDPAANAAAFGFHRAKDGRFVFLHPSFPQSREGLLRLLGAEQDRDQIAAIVARWDAQALEDAIAEAGVCGAVCRSGEEWDACEQGRMLATRPVVEVAKIADGDPEPFARDGAAPLSGTRVLDLTRVLAGPACARTLAQYGADAMVITAPDLPSVPYFVSDTGHGKRAAFADLKTEAGRQTLAELVRGADVFSQGYRQGALARLGFGVPESARLRPGLIIVEINCYGHEGPWRARPGWEQLAQTVTGLACAHGGAESPALLPAAACDYTTGYLAAFGTLIALERRARYGGTYLVRASLCQTGAWLRSLGLGDEARLGAVEAQRGEELASLSETVDSGFGPMRRTKPVVQLARTPARWAIASRPLGSDAPVW
jgi:crotonobetainyl-CoA:carnitine CoA-transferase CaiB-like acyl-CoA transferase